MAIQIPGTLEDMQKIFPQLVAQLMSAQQTVQEIIQANMGMRAALTLAQQDKSKLEAYIKNLLTPAQATSDTDSAPTDQNAPSDAPATDASENADTVSA